MSASPFDNNHYEAACDQAIAMCHRNLRSTIKALIIANEYLKAELQAAIPCDCLVKGRSEPASTTA